MVLVKFLFHKERNKMNIARTNKKRRDGATTALQWRHAGVAMARGDDAAMAPRSPRDGVPMARQ